MVFAPRLTPGPIESGVVAAGSLHEMLSVADFVSIHAPAAEAWLINTSRGALVDENALMDALRSARLGGAARDVLAQEPPDPENPQ